MAIAVPAIRNDVEAPAAAPVLRLVDVVREFPGGNQGVRAVDGVSLELAPGELVAVVGRSGSGKSTLLNLIAGLDRPTSGEVWVCGQALSCLGDDDLTRLRRDRLGIIYQFFNLLSTLSVRENVALPALLAGVRQGEALRAADGVLDEVELTHRAGARPHTLSGGEMQRAAIARALVRKPSLLLADEPTGNLDSRSAGQILQLMVRLGQAHRTTVVLVTHSSEASELMERTLEMRDGRLVLDERRGAR